MEIKTESELAASMHAEVASAQHAAAERLTAEHAQLQCELAQARLEMQQHVRLANPAG